MPTDEVEIVPYQDGPYLVRGPAVLRDQDGREIYAGRRTIALCRCGKSRMRPFCDGTHQLIRFKAGSGAEEERQHRLVADDRAGRPAPRANGSIKTGLKASPAGVDSLAATHDCVTQAVSLLSTARVLLASSLEAVPDAPKVIEQLSVLVARLQARSDDE